MSTQPGTRPDLPDEPNIPLGSSPGGSKLTMFAFALLYGISLAILALFAWQRYSQR
jgi:hypothetical protein